MKTKSKLFYVILICMLAVIFAALTACGDEQEGSATPTDSYIISTPGAADGQSTGKADTSAFRSQPSTAHRSAVNADRADKRRYG